MKRLIRARTDASEAFDTIVFSISRALPKGFNYKVSVVDEGLLVTKECEENIDVYIDDIELKQIMEAMQKGLDTAYSKVVSDITAGKKRGKQAKIIDRASFEVNPDPAYPYREAEVAHGTGGAYIYVLMKLTEAEALARLNKADDFDVYAFDLESAEKLIPSNTWHGFGTDKEDAPHIHKKSDKGKKSKPHVFYGKITPERNLIERR